MSSLPVTANDPSKISTITQHIELLDNGRLGKDLNDALRSMVAEIETVGSENGGKAKGEITIKLGFKLEKGIYELTGDFTAKEPKKRRRSNHAWATPDNHLSHQNPNQVEMFANGGARIVGADQGARLA